MMTHSAEAHSKEAKMDHASVGIVAENVIPLGDIRAVSKPELCRNDHLPPSVSSQRYSTIAVVNTQPFITHRFSDSPDPE